jgi:hypothetical protein
MLMAWTVFVTWRLIPVVVIVVFTSNASVRFDMSCTSRLTCVRMMPAATHQSVG